MKTVTYADVADHVEPLALALERIAHRLRQGAISEEIAIIRLNDITAQLDPKGSM